MFHKNLMLFVLLFLPLALCGCSTETDSSAKEKARLDSKSEPGKFTKDALEAFEADREKYRAMTGIDEERKRQEEWKRREENGQ